MRLVTGFLIILFIAISCTGNVEDPTLSKVRKNPTTDSIISLLSSAKEFNSNPDIPAQKATLALNLSKKINDPALMTNSYIMLAVTLFNTRADSAYNCIHKAFELARQYNLEQSLPLIKYNSGKLYFAVSDYISAIKEMDSCIMFAKGNGDVKLLADGYNELGNIYYTSKNLPMAKDMYDSSLNISKRNFLFLEMGVSMSNLTKFDSLEERIVLNLKNALQIVLKTKGNEEEAASICSNIAVHFSNPDSVLFYSEKAIGFLPDNSGTPIAIAIYNNLAYGYLDKGMIRKAEECLTKYAIPLAVSTENDDWLATVYDSYAEILMKKGDAEGAYQFAGKSIKSQTNAIEKTAIREIRLLGAMTNVKEKNEMIKKGNEELAKKNASMRFLILFIMLLILMITGIVLIFFQILLKKRLDHERMLNKAAKRIISLEENEKGKISRELHDLIGPMIMAIRKETEELPIDDPELKKNIEEKIVTLAENLRSLSHRMNMVLQQNHSFFELLIGLCQDMGKISGLNIELVLPEKEPSLSRDQIVQLFRIIQELLTNAVKHVKDGTVKISINREQKRLFLFYEDSGLGFLPDQNTGDHMGLINICERAEFLGGIARVETKPGSGTRWFINVPLIKSEDNG